MKRTHFWICSLYICTLPKLKTPNYVLCAKMFIFWMNSHVSDYHINSWLVCQKRGRWNPGPFSRLLSLKCTTQSNTTSTTTLLTAQMNLNQNILWDSKCLSKKKTVECRQYMNQVRASGQSWPCSKTSGWRTQNHEMRSNVTGFSTYPV